MAYVIVNANRVEVDAGSGYGYEAERLTPEEARALADEILLAADIAEMCPEPPPYVRQPTPEGVLNGYFDHIYADPNCRNGEGYLIFSDEPVPFRPRSR